MIMLAVASVFSDTTADDPVAFYLLGSVNAEASLSVSLFEEVFPFNLDGSDVAYNSSYDSIVRGLRIGQYTLISNANTTKLYITHSQLVLTGTDGSDLNGKKRKIDYRLYAMVNYNNVEFESCVSDENAGSPLSASNRIVVSGSVKLVNKSLYVSLDEGDSTTTAEAIEDLAEGTYKSNIYFILEGE